MNKIQILKTGNIDIRGTKLIIDGVEIPELVNVEFEHHAGSVPTVRATMNALYFDVIEFDANVNIEVRVFPGYELIKEMKDNKQIFNLRRVGVK